MTSVGSLVLTFIGIPAASLPGILNKDIASIFLIPLTPIILLILSFASNDLFHIYAIGTRIGELEKNINKFLNNPNLLGWEHLICPVVYGGVERTWPKPNGKKVCAITNLIKVNDYYVLMPFVAIVCGFSTTLGAIFLFHKNLYLFIFYVVVIAYFTFILLSLVGRTLMKYTRPENPLKENISTLSEL